MCDLSIAGLAATLASTVVGGIVQYQEAQAQAAAARQVAEYKAQVAEGEAETRRNLARAEIEKGAAERDRIIRAGLAKQGEIAGGLGASGFTLDQGTNLSLLGQSAEEIQQDVSLAGHNAALKAWNHLAGAAKAGNEGARARLQGQADQGTANSKLAGTILGTLGQGLTGYYKIKNWKP
jgi:hypothetical protein